MEGLRFCDGFYELKQDIRPTNRGQLLVTIGVAYGNIASLSQANH